MIRSMDNFLLWIFTFLSGALGILVWALSAVVRDHLPKVADNSKISESRWSYLPVDVLEIINGKLDIFDNASMNCVCRNWWFASINYPERKTIGDGMPWILQPSISTRGALELISITRKKKIILELPEFRRGEVLFSKQGWVLICLKKFCQSSNKLFHYLFLLNPMTKAIIQLPEHVISSRREYKFVRSSSRREYKYVRSIIRASFSIHNGHPHHVVLYKYDYLGFSLKVAQVGDKMWTTHSFECQCVCCPEVLTALLIIGQDVYCCYLFGEIVIYNINSQAWKEVEVVDYSQETRNYYIEYEGQVVRYQQNEDPQNCGNELSYFSNSDNVWKKMSDDFRNDKNINGDRIFRSFVCAMWDGFSGCLDEKSDAQSWPEELNKENDVPFPVHQNGVWVDIG